MNKYSIKELEQYSGIKAHTIRIWEKRYELLQPLRTDTNIRYYSDAELVKLLNISTLINHGWKVSHISQLDSLQLNGEVEKISDSANSGEVAYDPFINKLITAMTKLDEMQFEKVFSACILRFGLFDTMIKVIYPFLEKVGLLWSVNKIKPVHEHFATNIIRQKLLAAIDGLVTPDENKSKFLLYLFQKESHEIGLLFSNFILRSLGHRVLYLGQNLPTSNLLPTQGIWKAENFLTFFVMAYPASVIQAHLDWIASTFPETSIYISINKSVVESLQLPKNVFPLFSIDDLVGAK